jgi:hypothetical protein
MALARKRRQLPLRAFSVHSQVDTCANHRCSAPRLAEQRLIDPDLRARMAIGRQPNVHRCAYTVAATAIRAIKTNI